MLGDVPLASNQTVLSKSGMDLTGYFIFARESGFGQLRQDNLALLGVRP